MDINSNYETEVDLATTFLIKNLYNDNQKTSNTDEIHDIYFENDDDNYFVCKLCNIRFTKESHGNHVEYHSYDGINVSLEIKYICKDCQELFTSLDEFKVHLMRHTIPELYKCKYCKKEFTQKTSLDNHKRIHTGEKPFECKICDKKFRIKSYLNIHLRIHSGERPFKCNICNKSFTQKNSLDNHKRIHSGKKPFECKICDKKFSVKIYLQSHLRTHNNDIEVPNGCPNCDDGKLYECINLD